MFEDVMGANQAAIVDDPLTKKGFELWYERVLRSCGSAGGVDVEVIANELTLNDRTAEYIYSDFTIDDIRYVPGSRPMLESVVAETTADGMSDREKALALMRRCRDNRDHGLARPGLFSGGTEEELLKRGAIVCHEISRLFACLCQIAGLPCRLFCAQITGHMTNEVKVEGKWWWMDVENGFAPVDDTDGPVSAWELSRDTSLFDRQPRSVIEDCRAMMTPFSRDDRHARNVAYCLCWVRCCFHPREAMAIGNYYVWEHERYTYPWSVHREQSEAQREATREEHLNRKAAGWPDYYFDASLFDQELKTRD